MTGNRTSVSICDIGSILVKISCNESFHFSLSIRTKQKGAEIVWALAQGTASSEQAGKATGLTGR